MTEFISAVTKLSVAHEGRPGVPSAVYGLTWGNGGYQQFFPGITNQSASFPDPEVDMGQYGSFGQQREGLFKVRDRKITLSAGNLPFLPTNGRFLYYGFGKDVIVGAGADRAHYFTCLSKAILPSFTMAASFEGNPNFARFFTGCTVGSLAFTLTEGQELQATMEYKALYVHTQSDSDAIFDYSAASNPDQLGHSVPEDEGTPWMFYDVGATEVNMGGEYVRETGKIIGGRTFARISGFNCRVNNNLREKHYMRGKKAVSDGGGPFDSGQWPHSYLATRPSFELNLDVVPAGHTGGVDASGAPTGLTTSPSDDEVYDLLVNSHRDGRPMLLSNVVIPFQRVIGGQTQTLHLIFKDCRISNASHQFNEDGSEPTVSVTVTPRSFHIRMNDGTFTQYPALPA